jgi:alpha-1,2-mannosyltransferase
VGHAAQAAWTALWQPPVIGGRRLPPIGLVVLAAIGGCFLVIVALTRWGAPQDEHAYWLAGQRLLAGQPLYDSTATSVTPYAFWYPPPVAQAIAPITAILSSEAFSLAWTALLLSCLLGLGLGRPLVALALVAFIPVPVELWFRNIHLLLAAIVALGVVRWPWMFAVGAVIKLAPGLGIVYLVAGGRWRDAAIATLVGVAIVGLSVLFGPGLWTDFSAMVQGRGAADISGVLAIPYAVRAAAGVALAVAAARIRPTLGEPLLVVAVVVAAPTLWVNALSMLVAIVPIAAWRHRATAGTGSFELSGA